MELKNKNLSIIGLVKLDSKSQGWLWNWYEYFGFDKFINENSIEVKLNDHSDFTFKIDLTSLDELLEKSDFVTLHVPAQRIYNWKERIQKNEKWISNY